MTTKTCYLPDRSASDFVACDTTSEHSGCCGTGSSCMGEGLCLTNSTLLYRGCCTDINWESDSCPKICYSDDPTSRNYGPANGIQFISSCFDLNSDYLNPPWACGRNATCASETLFYLPLLSYPFKTNLTTDSTSGVEASSTSRSITATITITASPTAKPSNNGHTTTVGAAVGAVLGFAFLVALGWAILERRKRKKLDTQLRDALSRKTVAAEATTHEHRHLLPGRGAPQLPEMTGDPKKTYELPDSRRL